MWKTIIIFQILSNIILLSNQIFIPISYGASRCMVVYTVGQTQTIKLDINFPSLPLQQDTQHFEISWRNTMNGEVGNDNIKNGRYRKQLALVQNTIYQLCIKVQCDRVYGTIYIEYNSHSLFPIRQTDIKIPDNLLKEQDMTKSYISITNIQTHLDEYIKTQNIKTDTHVSIFKQTNKVNSHIVFISIIEIFIVLAAGCYQFWNIWNYLKCHNQI